MINFKNAPAYKATTKPDTICVPPILFIKVDGKGAPSSKDFQEALQIVYGIFYSIKFWDKKHTPPQGYDKFTTAPLEAMWWTGVGTEFDPQSPDKWQWTALMRVPDFVTQTYFNKVVKELCSTKNTDIYKKARLESVHEGFCVQILHIGPYSDEHKSLDSLRIYAKKNDYEIYGRHHEIYLNDPNRTSAEKLKTVLRYPVRKADGAEILINQVHKETTS